MDDYLGGANSVDEVIQLINEVILVHSKAGFKICNWITNSSEVLKQIDPNLQKANSNGIEIDNALKEKILGLWWNYETDKFSYNFKFNKIPTEVVNLTRRPTKREIHSHSCQCSTP